MEPINHDDDETLPNFIKKNTQKRVKKINKEQGPKLK